MEVIITCLFFGHSCKGISCKGISVIVITTAPLYRYDPQKAAWESSKGMVTLRSRVGVAVVNRKLYAFGGYDGSSRLYTVECYDPEVSPM